MPIETNSALNLQVIPESDTLSLEHGDRIMLKFTHINPIFTPEEFFAATEEFLRDYTFVYIIDDDSKYKGWCDVPL